MRSNCTKCRDDTEGGKIFVEAGIGFLFCKTCSDILDKLPPGSLRSFVGKNREESQEMRNIREARERREKGQSVWN